VYEVQIYKDKQFLVFDFEDGKTVKYDFATKQAIGKSGRVVNNLCSQLGGLTMGELCDCCTDKAYGKFLKFVQGQCTRNVTNIGTILSRVPLYANYEQLFSAGIEGIVTRDFRATINDIPKGCLKLCKSHNITLSNDFLKSYKQNPDAFNLAYDLNYYSLNDSKITEMLNYRIYVGGRYYGNDSWVSVFCHLINNCGYTAKALCNYIDYLCTFEAMDNIGYLMRDLWDYVKMMQDISPKFEKYPRHFLTTHEIASRNYQRLKKQFEEAKFQQRIDKSLERTFGEYRFYYPESTQAIKDEATAMSNCVASYIDKVIDGRCHILFLRYKDRPDESLVTIEVRENQIIQALQKFNHPLTKEQREVVNAWNSWQKNKLKNNTKESESEE
jgi:hypothetical protein